MDCRHTHVARRVYFLCLSTFQCTSQRWIIRRCSFCQVQSPPQTSRWRYSPTFGLHIGLSLCPFMYCKCLGCIMCPVTSPLFARAADDSTSQTAWNMLKQVCFESAWEFPVVVAKEYSQSLSFYGESEQGLHYNPFWRLFDEGYLLNLMEKTMSHADNQMRTHFHMHRNTVMRQIKSAPETVLPK